MCAVWARSVWPLKGDLITLSHLPRSGKNLPLRSVRRGVLVPVILAEIAALEEPANCISRCRARPGLDHVGKSALLEGISAWRKYVTLVISRASSGLLTLARRRSGSGKIQFTFFRARVTSFFRAFPDNISYCVALAACTFCVLLVITIPKRGSLEFSCF